MAMRQYIGARYVPKFFDDGNGSNEWAGSTISYEALTVVTHLGASYTSRKPVPVGVNITNTEYWILTANYNAEILQIKERLDDVEDEIGEITGTKQKRLVCIGDSFLAGVGLSDKTQNWGRFLANSLGASGSTGSYTTYGVGGIGFTKGSGSGEFATTPIPGLISGYITQHEQNPEEVTHVVIMAGWNDSDRSSTPATSSAVISQAILNSVSACKDLFPNAELWVFCNATHQYPGIKLLDAFNLANSGSNYNNVHLIANSWKWLFGCPYRYVQNDQIHPTVEGEKFIGNYMYNTMMGGSCDSGNFTYELDLADSEVITQGKFQLYFHDGKCSIYCRATLQNASSGTTIVANNLPRALWLRTDSQQTLFSLVTSLQGSVGNINLVNPSGTASNLGIYKLGAYTGSFRFVAEFDPMGWELDKFVAS